MAIEKCKVCESEFDTLALEEGKCAICKVEYPNANSHEEAVQQTVPEKERVTNLTEDRVRVIVREAFADVKDAIEQMITTRVDEKINEYLGSDD